MYIIMLLYIHICSECVEKQTCKPAHLAGQVYRLSHMCTCGWAGVQAFTHVYMWLGRCTGIHTCVHVAGQVYRCSHMCTMLLARCTGVHTYVYVHLPKQVCWSSSSVLPKGQRQLRCWSGRDRQMSLHPPLSTAHGSSEAAKAAKEAVYVHF